MGKKRVKNEKEQSIPILAETSWRKRAKRQKEQMDGDGANAERESDRD